MRNRLVVILCLLLTACAVTPLRPPPDPGTARCLALYDTVDRVVAERGYSPSWPARIDGFAYRRVDRFLADFRAQPCNAEQRTAWIARLAQLDREARRVELAALPPSALDDLTRRYTAPATLEAALQTCSRTLQAYDLDDAERFAALRTRASVPPDYLTVRQIVGLYPLSSLPVSIGVARWHAQARRIFAQPLDTLPVNGQLRRFRPPDAAVQPPPFATLPRDALGIPELDAGQLTTLFTVHAPVWEIDTVGPYDLPGAPYWQAQRLPDVDTRRPVVYRYPSYVRWRNQVLLQLNYVIWFSERPASGPLDILAGALDGLVWRVTLDSQGRPLLYDSIHNCGCYHQFFPAAALRLRSEAADLPEPPLVPQPAPRLILPADRGATEFRRPLHRTDLCRRRYRSYLRLGGLCRPVRRPGRRPPPQPVRSGRPDARHGTGRTLAAVADGYRCAGRDARTGPAGHRLRGTATFRRSRFTGHLVRTRGG